MIGRQFGKLTVLAEDEPRSGKRRWLCRCECGAEKVMWQDSLNRGAGSCGCDSHDVRQRRWNKFRESNRGFWSKVQQTESCWIWTGSTDSGGYGQVGSLGRTSKAHRLSWEIHNGPIPGGMHVMHICDNRSCVNPEHLALGTHADNMRDMAQKGRATGLRRGASNGRSKLTDQDRDEICAEYSQGLVTQAELAKRYGVVQTTISALVRSRGL